MKRIFGFVLALLCFVLAAGCSSPSSTPRSSNMTAEYAKDDVAYEIEAPADVPRMEAGYSAQMNPVAGGGDYGSGLREVNPNTSSRKIITTINLHLETKEFDTGVDKIVELAEQFGGYVESSYVEGKSLYDERGSRSARYTLRIPADSTNNALSTFGEHFNITSTDQSGNDVTDSYYDMEARLNSLKIQEEQLIKMLEQAEELEYLLEVQRELANVRYEIESLTSSLMRMESQVSMSTVYVYLQEVVEYEQIRNTPATFAQELQMTMEESGAMFARFCRGIVLFFVLFFPYLIILAAVILLAALLHRRKKRRTDKELQKLQQNLRVRPLQVQEAEIKPEEDSSDPKQE